MKKFAFGVICLVLGVVVYSYIDSQERQIDNKEYEKAEKFYQCQVVENTARKEIDEAKSLNDLYKIEELPQDLRDHYALKEAALLFKKAEAVLSKAVQIENAFYVQPPPPADPKEEPRPQELHPKTVKLLKECETYYDQARKIVDTMPESSDKDFNFRVNYLKGVIYHRYFSLFSNKENVSELFNQTITHYKTALKYKEGDINTVINIELLIKDGGGLIGGNSPQSKKNKMLNLNKAGLGKHTGN